MLDKNKNKAFHSHLKLIKTYKELKKILPFGFIKESLSRGQKYSFKKHPLLINFEKEKNNENSPTKITKNLFYKKNIYIYSEENEKTKKLITNYKKYFSDNKSRKFILTKSQSNIINGLQNISSNSGNISNNNSPLNFKKTKKNFYFKAFSNKELNKTGIKIHRNGINLYSNYDKNIYRNSFINNSVIKNNVYLPNITYRMKNSLPRYKRQYNGLLLNGIGVGKDSFTKLDIYINIFNKKLLNEKKRIIRRTIFIKNKSISSFTQSDY